MSKEMTEKVPQVVGKESKSTCELIDKFRKVAEVAMGKEWFCTLWYLPTCPGFGMIEKGKD